MHIERDKAINLDHNTECAAIMYSGVGRGVAQGARAPPSALGLVHIFHTTASPSTPLATPNHQKKQLRRQLKTYDLDKNLELPR